MISYREPWGFEHLFGAVFCVLWNAVVAAFVEEAWRTGRWWSLATVVHLPIGLFMAYSNLRWFRNWLHVTVTSHHVERRSVPVPPSCTWRMTRASVAAVVVTQRLYENDGAHVQWTLTVQPHAGGRQSLMSKNILGEAALPPAMARFASELADALEVPLIHETRDER